MTLVECNEVFVVKMIYLYYPLFFTLSNVVFLMHAVMHYKIITVSFMYEKKNHCYLKMLIGCHTERAHVFFCF